MGASTSELAYAMPAADRGARSEMSAAALQGFPVAPLRPPPGAKPANLAELPFDNFEPPPELLKSSGWRFGGKILKLLKLRRKSSSASRLRTAVEELDQGRVFHFQDLISHSTQFPTPLIHDVTKRYNYDSDEHSGTQNSSSSSSSSSISSSSRNSNSSEFDSHRSSGTPRSPFCSGPLSNSQLMASILISIMDEEDSAGSASEEHGSSEDEVHIIASLTGPHESAWHQPRDEMLAADLLTVRGRQSGSSSKHLVNSERHAPKSNTRSALAVDGRLTSPGPSRRFGKLNLSRIEVHKLR